MMATVKVLITDIEKKKWVCPIPSQWSKLWKLLPERRRNGAGWEPPLPLILAAWWETSDVQKHERFLSHLRWADEHNALPLITDFVLGLDEDDWHKEDK